MSLSEISDKDAVTSAINEFDSVGRDAFLAKYGFRKARSYFLRHDNKFYDSKAIAGAAHGYQFGTPLTNEEFSGGESTVRPQLEKLGFVVVVMGNQPLLIPVDELQPGDTLNNDGLGKTFNVGNMGGMRRSLSEGHLVIISDPTKMLYDDRWEGSILHYTGMGKVGDQTLSSQNKTLAESKTNGVRVHLFEVYTPKEYVYAGKVELAGGPYQEQQIDDKGNDRKVWMFPLRLKGGGVAPVPWSEQIIEVSKARQRRLKNLSLSDLRKRAQSRKSPLGRRIVQSEKIARDENVVRYVKVAADGHCDLCREAAPFKDKDGEPFLECHHVEHLAKGGKDTISNAVALCPNCHRKMHALGRAGDCEKLLKRIEKRE